MKIGDVIAFECEIINITYKKYDILTNRTDNNPISSNVLIKFKKFNLMNNSMSKTTLKDKQYSVPVGFMELYTFIRHNFKRLIRSRIETGHDVREDDLDMLYSFDISMMNKNAGPEKYRDSTLPHFHLRIISIFKQPNTYANKTFIAKPVMFRQISKNILYHDYKIKLLLSDKEGLLYIFPAMYFRPLNDYERRYSPMLINPDYK
jgi:hypothetical protein